MAMTSRERFSRMFSHTDADRVPILDSPWGTTLERWRREGMPADANWQRYFDLDWVVAVGADNGPRFEHRTLEETDEYTVVETSWGAKLKNWKHIASTPDFIDFRIHSADAWREIKKRITPSRDRVDWARLKKDYPAWRQGGAWIEASLWFGFDVTHSWMVGTERVLMALVEDPEWLMDMWNTQLDTHIALFEMMLAEGYTFDCVVWPDDLGYKGHTFMSPAMYRELLKPVHGRAIEWAHRHGMKARLHSCGDIRTLIGDFTDIGLDALNPLEVKAGVDTLEVKRRHGDKLVLHGGMNAVLWDSLDAMEQEIRTKLPELKKNGGYIWSTDHSIPDNVSLEDFRRIIGIVKDVGAY